MGLERFIRPVYEKEAEHGSSHSQINPESTDEITEWMTAGAIASKASRTHGFVKSLAEKHRENHPEWFADKKSRGVEYEHYSPALSQLIIQEASSRTLPPEGWKTINAVAKDLDRNSETLRKIQETYRAEHPEWFKEYIASNKRPQEHLSPELIEVIIKKSQEVAYAPDGWMNVTAVRKKLDIYFKTVVNMAKKYIDADPMLAKEYRNSTGHNGLHYSPELIKKIENEVGQNEPPPIDWSTMTKIAKDMRKDGGTIRDALDEMGEVAGGKEYWSNTGLTKYYPPETVQLLERRFSQYTEAPKNWLTREDLQNFLDVSKPTTWKLIKQFSAKTPQDVKIFYNPRGHLATYVSKDFANLVKKEMGIEPLEKAIIPYGWKSRSELAAANKATNDSIQKLVESFLQTHAIDEHVKRIETNRDGPKPRYYSPELADYIAHELSNLNQPPTSGWLATTDVLKELKTTLKTLKAESQEYRATRPEWFRLYSIHGTTREYFSPELITILRGRLHEKRATAPSNWNTADHLQSSSNADSELIRDFANQYRDSHSEWFRQYQTADGVTDEHYGPRLSALIRSRLSTIQDAPSGWITNGGLARELEVSTATTARVAQMYRQSNPLWFGVYKRPSMQTSEFYAPELAEIIRTELSNRIPAPEGWLTNGEIAKQLNSYNAGIQKIADSYRESSPEWFARYARSDNRIFLYYAPPLVEIILKQINAERDVRV